MADWRDVQAQLLSAFAEVGQVKIAAAMGLAESTVSGMKTPQGNAKASLIETMARLVVLLDMRLVPESASVLRPGERAISAKKLMALETLAYESLERSAGDSL